MLTIKYYKTVWNMSKINKKRHQNDVICHEHAVNWCHSGVFLFNFKHVLLLVLLFLKLTLKCKLGILPISCNLTITNCFKELHPKWGRAPRFVFENVAMHENYFGFVWKPVLFLILKCCHVYWKSLFFSVNFYSVMKYFWSAF